jgi:hypothetical protein
MLTSSPPQAARIPTEPDLSLVSSEGSSHNRLTSAEDNEAASLLGCPPIGLVDKRNIEQSKEKRKRGLISPASTPRLYGPRGKRERARGCGKA